MHDDVFSYFKANQSSILTWGVVALMVIRILIGVIYYRNGMAELSKGLGSLFIMIFGIAYLIFPIDIIPDVLIIIGWIDDLVISLGAYFYTRAALTKVFWGDHPPRNRLIAVLLWYSGSVVLVWIFKYIGYLVS